MKDSTFLNKHTWNTGGKIIDLSTPKIMGIVNATPDSFYANSRKNAEHEVLTTVEQMLSDGADILDVGGYSSRPGAKDVNEEEELSRVVPVIKVISKAFPEVNISIDTFRASVARQAVEAGANIVNDISGGDLDIDMFSTIKDLQVPYIMMHMRGTPQTMQTHTEYANVVMDVVKELSVKLNKLRRLGVNDVAIDPGFGFSKTLEQNYELLHQLELLHVLDTPLLVGISRKSMLHKLLDITAEEALNATTVANTIALLNGASILRVHDVKEAVQARQIVTFTASATK